MNVSNMAPSKNFPSLWRTLYNLDDIAYSDVLKYEYHGQFGHYCCEKGHGNEIIYLLVTKPTFVYLFVCLFACLLCRCNNFCLSQYIKLLMVEHQIGKMLLLLCHLALICGPKHTFLHRNKQQTQKRTNNIWLDLVW